MPPKHVPGDDRSNATCQYLRSLGSLKSQPRRKQMNSIKEASQIMYIYIYIRTSSFERWERKSRKSRCSSIQSVKL